MVQNCLSWCPKINSTRNFDPCFMLMMDRRKISEGLEQVWSKHPCGFLKQPVVPMCGQFWLKVMDTTKWMAAQLNTQLTVMVCIFTSQLQPLDISINKSVWGVEQTDNSTRSWFTLSNSGNSHGNMCNWCYISGVMSSGGSIMSILFILLWQSIY